MEEYLSLNKEEKRQLIKSHIKNLQFTKYNLELNIIAEQAVDVPNESSIIGYQMQIEDLVDKESALQNELLLLDSEEKE